MLLTFAVLSLTAQSGLMDALQPHNVTINSVEFKGRKAARLVNKGDGMEVDRIAVLSGGPSFQNGTIEVDLAGSVAAGAGEGARGFVGIAFRVASDLKKFECFYLRPTNGRAEDQIRRNHSAQYISFPDFPWEKLRKETPEKYESYVDLQPGEWTKVRIVVDGANARLYVHGSEQPTLIVKDLKLGAAANGAVALWIGPGTEGHFSNLKITRK